MFPNVVKNVTNVTNVVTSKAGLMMMSNVVTNFTNDTNVTDVVKCCYKQGGSDDDVKCCYKCYKCYKCFQMLSNVVTSKAGLMMMVMIYI